MFKWLKRRPKHHWIYGGRTGAVCKRCRVELVDISLVLQAELTEGTFCTEDLFAAMKLADVDHPCLTKNELTVRDVLL